MYKSLSSIATKFRFVMVRLAAVVASVGVGEGKTCGCCHGSALVAPLLLFS